MLGGVATYFELQFYNENPIFKNFDLENKICEILIGRYLVVDVTGIDSERSTYADRNYIHGTT